MKTIVVLASLLLSSWAQSQTVEDGTKIPVDTNRLLQVQYGSSPWNKDSTQIDNAELFVRDKNSGKVLKILLEESEPDSSTFSGDFSVGFTKKGEITPEIYIPPENVRGNAGKERRFLERVRSGKGARKPVVFKKGNNGQQVLDVFDTKEQARASYSAFKEKMAKEKEKAKQEKIKPVVDKADIEAAALAARQAKLAALAAKAASREEERVRKEQLERQRAAELLRKQKALAAAERARRKAEAKALADQALQLYRQGDFLKAEELFKRSIELDPSNTSYYFKYGVTLYRNEKYDDALVVMNMAEVDENTKIEKSYYMGLIHFRLKELDPALEKFRFVKNSKHKIMAPSAAFYEGVILFNKEEFKEAKAPFEYVIDNSSDPRLDEKAEDFLDRIANAMIHQRKQRMRHDATVTLGLSYDSNVLFTPDNQTSSSTSDVGGVRTLAIADYQYRIIYDRITEWTLDLTGVYYYSAEDVHAAADPTLFTVMSPWVRKGVWNKKGFKFSIAPGYETLYLDSESSGTRANILNSMLLDTEITLVMRDDYFANYYLDIRQDDSLTADSIGDADADAFQPTLGTKHTFLLNEAKNEAFIAGFYYKLNNANGDEKKYNKIQIDFTYSRPFKKWENASWNTSLTYYQQNYSELTGDSERKDTNYALSAGFSKVHNNWWTWGANSTFTTNSSSNEDNQYDKYEVMFTSTFDIDETIFPTEK